MLLRKIFSILELKLLSFSIVVFFILILSLLEFLSLALIFPVLTNLLDENSMASNIYFDFFKKINLFNNLHFLLIALFITYLVKTFYVIILNRKIFLFVYDLQAKLRVKLAKDFYTNEIHDNEINASSYINFINNHSAAIAGTALLSYIRLFSDLMISLTLSLLIFFTSPRIFLFIFFSLLIFYFIYYLFSRKLFRQYGKKASQIQERLIKFIEYIVNSYKEIVTSSKSNFFIKRISIDSKDYAKTYTNFLVLNIIPKYLIELIIVIGIIIIAFGINTNRIALELSSLAIILATTVKMYPLFNSLISSVNKIKFSIFQINEIYEVLKNKKVFNNEKFEDFQFQKIKIENLTFTNKEKLILNNLNFQFRRGDIVAVIGPSGSGKTTFVDILLGFKKKYSGKILINDNYTNKFNLRSISYYISQEAKLFNDTLAKNITLEEKTSDTKKLKSLINKFSLENFISDNTIINENSTNLSGGQIQKILLARCFYHNKSIIILDESTSAIDTNSEKLISKIILESKDKTFIIIGHRSNLLKLANVTLEL